MLRADGRWPSGGKLSHRTPALVAKAKETSALKPSRPVSKYFPGDDFSTFCPAVSVFVILLSFFFKNGQRARRFNYFSEIC